MKHVFCFGLGYVAQYFVDSLRNWRISGTTRSPSEHFHQFSDEHLLGNPDKIFDTVTHILISIPPSHNSIVKLYAKYFTNVEWIGYLSSTHVYGNHDGNWVNEDSKLLANDPMGEKRIVVEREWLHSDLPVHIFRLSGIYGKQRNILERLKADNAIRYVQSDTVFSRIHVDDIVQVLHASINAPNPYNIYNIADNLPARYEEIVIYASSLLNITIPPPAKFHEISPIMQQFYKSHKRVSNNKIIQELNIKLKYPTYKIGLQSLLDTNLPPTKT